MEPREPFDVFEDTDGILSAKLPQLGGRFVWRPVGIMLGICAVHSIVTPDEGAMEKRWGIENSTMNYDGTPDHVCFDCVVKLGIALGGAR